MSRKRILAVIICVLLTSCDYPPKLEEENLGEIHIHIDHYKQANQTSSGVKSSYKFTCEEQDFLYIESKNKNKIGMLIEFLYPQTSSEPFVFNQIKCSAHIATFEEACNSY